MSLGSPFGTQGFPDAEAADERRQGGRGGRDLGRQRRPEPVHRRFAGQRRRVPSRSRPAIRRKASPARCFREHRRRAHSRCRTRTAQASAARTTPSWSCAIRTARCRWAAIRRRTPAANVAGKLVVTQRGTCARVARAVFAQKAGAAAAAMIDTSTGYPPFEGPITSNPDTGEQYTVTIPFFGVRGLASTPDVRRRPPRRRDQRHRDPGAAAEPRLPAASHRSRRRGPRTGDSALKPDITAPGVAIVSTAVGFRQRLRDPVRHVDGSASRDRRGGAHAAGASELEGRRDQGCDRQHRRS